MSSLKFRKTEKGYKVDGLQGEIIKGWVWSQWDGSRGFGHKITAWLPVIDGKIVKGGYALKRGSALRDLLTANRRIDDTEYVQWYTEYEREYRMKFNEGPRYVKP